MRRILVLLAAALGTSLLPAPAAARVGLFFGFSPGFYPAPYLAPPPFYYAPPPPATFPPPPGYGAPYGYIPGTVPSAPAPAAGICRAGRTTCDIRVPLQPGDACSCDTGRGLAWGRVN